MTKAAPFLATAISLALLGGFALAQSPSQQVSPSPSPSTSTSPSPSGSPTATASAGTVAPDVAIAAAVNFVHYSDQLEITLGNEALTRLTNQSAINLAQAMVNDDETNEQQVLDVVDTDGLVLYDYVPSTYESAAQAALAALPDTSYDATFVKHVAEVDQAAVSQLQILMNGITDQSVLKLINGTITILQRHISLAGAVPTTTASPSPSPTPSSSASASPSPSPSASSMLGMALQSAAIRH